MSSATGWDVFGTDAANGAAPMVVAPPAREDADVTLAKALRPFSDAAGSPIAVPARPKNVAGGSGSYSIWPWLAPPPFGPVELASTPSSGRGFVATEQIEVGQVLLIEAPIVSWPRGADRTPETLLRALLTSPRRDDKLRALARLHPLSLADVDAALLHKLREEHRPVIDVLLPLVSDDALLALVGAARLSGGGSGGDDDEAAAPPAEGEREAATPPAGGEADPREALLRLCLVVRWNGFDSGLFLHGSIFNHANARIANCDKSVVDLAADAGAHARLGASAALAGGKARGHLSVVRATRRIAPGEECTICYAVPAELSRAAATARMRHFEFDPHAGCEPHALLDGEPHAGSADGGAPNGGAANGYGGPWEWTLPLERAARSRLRSAASKSDLAEVADAVRDALEPLARACGERSLALAFVQRAASDGLRARLRHAVEERLANNGEMTGDGGGDGGVGGENGLGGGDGEARALCMLLEIGLSRWETLRLLLGPTHPECAQPLHDVASCINTLLATAPRALFAAAGGRWGTARLASHAERRASELHGAIAALYSRAAIDELLVGHARLVRAERQADRARGSDVAKPRRAKRIARSPLASPPDTPSAAPAAAEAEEAKIDKLDLAVDATPAGRPIPDVVDI